MESVFLCCMDWIISDGMKETLLNLVSFQEVKDAAFNMGTLKALGPDGFQWVFYYRLWQQIHAEVQGTCADFLRGASNSSAINKTNLVLIPKILEPQSVSLFRPISLCNFSYKVLSKVMVNQIKPLLPSIISPTQSSFVA
ncbi:hypothetical protein GBA52_024971 [Prunus armeniaca]|nr:hypothetical protein GBA52_024971 [Prunus armeniaca]